MITGRAQALDDFLARHADRGDWPGGVYAVGPPGDEPRWARAVGRLASEPRKQPARRDALYDLSSLTKALVTAPLVMRLAVRGQIDPERPADGLLPEMTGYAGRTPSLVDLLTHRSGLPAWAALYRRIEQRDDLARAIAGLMPESPAGTRATYSCFGPMLAGLALERATGHPLDRLLHEELRAPLGIAPDDLRFGPLPEAIRPRAAPTEAGRRYEASIAGDGPLGQDIVPGPGSVLRGEVHDGNACFVGGAAGNAGLFGTARAVFRVASELSCPGRLFSEAGLRPFREAWEGEGGERRTLGFQSGGSPDAPAGRLGTSSYGHVGFTGTSVWIAPDVPLVVVLLTNRVHPAWREAPIQSWRRAFHDLSLSAAAGVAT
ncbi:MAG: beta-lactamase family protein [Acidobacteriota bacterium]|nr:beta-lactamase family protein [Acidobacteriota bacterium]